MTTHVCHERSHSNHSTYLFQINGPFFGPRSGELVEVFFAPHNSSLQLSHQTWTWTEKIFSVEVTTGLGQIVAYRRNISKLEHIPSLRECSVISVKLVPPRALNGSKQYFYLSLWLVSRLPGRLRARPCSHTTTLSATPWGDISASISLSLLGGVMLAYRPMMRECSLTHRRSRSILPSQKPMIWGSHCFERTS